MLSPLQLSAIVLAINLAAFASFWADKRLAKAGARRIRESTLLWLAMLGGTPGALSAQHLLRHKTRKEPFRTRLHLIVFLQAVALAIWLLVPDPVTGLLDRLPA